MTTKIKHLHPQLKKCKCGFVGKRNRLYQHLEVFLQFHRGDTQVFYSIHGEVPLNVGDKITI